MQNVKTAHDALVDVTLFDPRLAGEPIAHILDEVFAAERRRAAYGIDAGVIDAGVTVAARELTRRRAVAAADLRLPDGAGCALALRERGRRLVETINGAQFFAQLCRRAAMRELSVYFLGGLPGVAEANARAAEALASGLIVAGVHDGCFPVEETEDVIDEIDLSVADVLLVGYGAPREEARLDPEARDAGADEASALATIDSADAPAPTDVLVLEAPRLIRDAKSRRLAAARRPANDGWSAFEMRAAA